MKSKSEAMYLKVFENNNEGMYHEPMKNHIEAMYHEVLENESEPMYHAVFKNENEALYFEVLETDNQSSTHERETIGSNTASDVIVGTHSIDTAGTCMTVIAQDEHILPEPTLG